MRIYGINPVLEGLRAGRVTAIRIAARGDDRLTGLLRLAQDQRITITRVAPGELDRLTRGAVHQGVVAEARLGDHLSVEDLIVRAKGAALIVVLDGIEDPHN